MRIDRQQKVTIALLAGMVSLYVGAVWLPQRMTEGVLESRLKTARAAANPSDATADDLKALMASVDQLRQSVRRDRRVVPSQPQLAELIKQLSGALEEQSVTEQEIQTQPVIQGATYGAIPVTLRFRAEFPAVCRFIAKVESMDRVVQITRVGVEAPRSTSKERRAPEVHIELVAFFAPVDGSKP